MDIETETRCQTPIFIECIRRNPIIYDRRIRERSSEKERASELAWNKVAVKTNMSVDGAKKRYKALREKYVKIKNRNAKNRELNRNQLYWAYADQFAFLDPHIEYRSRVTNNIDDYASFVTPAKKQPIIIDRKPKIEQTTTATATTTATTHHHWNSTAITDIRSKLANVLDTINEAVRKEQNSISVPSTKITPFMQFLMYKFECIEESEIPQLEVDILELVNKRTKKVKEEPY